jgi:hypothetical protein
MVHTEQVLQSSRKKRTRFRSDVPEVVDLCQLGATVKGEDGAIVPVNQPSHTSIFRLSEPNQSILGVLLIPAFGTMIIGHDANDVGLFGRLGNNPLSGPLR